MKNIEKVIIANSNLGGGVKSLLSKEFCYRIRTLNTT